MSKITIRFKSGRTKQVDATDLPKIRNTFPSVQVVVDKVRPPRPKREVDAIELSPADVDTLLMQGNAQSNDVNTISGE